MSIRAIRSLDGIAIAIGVFLLLIIFPGAARDPLGRLTVVICLPLAFAAWCAWRLPADLLTTRHWQRSLARLRLWSLLAAGLAPFIPWYTVTPVSGYLLINALLGCYAFIATCFYTNEVAFSISHQLEPERSELPAVIGRYGTMYFFFCSLTAIAVHVLPGLWRGIGNPLDVIHQIAYQNVLVFVVLAAVVLLWLLLIALCGVIMPLRSSRLLQRHAITTIPALTAAPPEEDHTHA